MAFIAVNKIVQQAKCDDFKPEQYLENCNPVEIDNDSTNSSQQETDKSKRVVKH